MGTNRTQAKKNKKTFIKYCLSVFYKSVLVTAKEFNLNLVNLYISNTYLNSLKLSETIVKCQFSLPFQR